MRVPFAKISGAGNDFILLDRRPPRSLKRLARRLCGLRSGIGADGLLILERTPRLRLGYFNSDGSKAFCGNGARCAAWWMKSRGWTKGRGDFRIQTGAGPIGVRIRRGRVAVSMPRPTGMRLGRKLTVLGRSLSADSIVVGVPHAVVEVKNLKRVPVASLGRAIRRHPCFMPRGANANFISIARGRIALRTYERGVEAETLACGTGAAASALTAWARGRVKPPVAVKARGGTLRVSFKTRPLREVWLVGPVRLIKEGTITI